jgi:hypothetical protein
MEDMIRQLDKDGDGEIDYVEFAKQYGSAKADPGLKKMMDAVRFLPAFTLPSSPSRRCRDCPFHLVRLLQKIQLGRVANRSYREDIRRWRGVARGAESEKSLTPIGTSLAGFQGTR